MKNGVTGSFAGITTDNNYNSRMQPVFLSAAAPGGTVMSFGYDFHLGAGNNGNVFQITNNLNNDRTQIFTYDELNRLATAKTQALIGQHCWGHTFGYDIWANLTSRGVFTGYNGCTGEGPVPAATVKNQMAGHTYDAAGNYWPTGYSYDAENRLISAPGSMSFDYDHSGRRVRKSSGATGTLYYHGTGGEVLAETNLSGGLLREFIYFNGKRVARRTDGSYQSSLTIQNGLLSQANPFDQPPCYCYNLGPIPGWNSTGAATGSWQPTTASYNAPLPGTIAYSNGGTISQTLGTGLQANTTYTLLVDVGRRLEGFTADYSLTLQVGSTVLATLRRSNGLVGAGSFHTQALVYTAGSTPPAGNLTIVLESHGMQVNFKNVRLNLSSVGPVHYFFSDHLGSSNIVTDSAGVTKEESDYYPFGAERIVTDTLADQNYKFTGKERDTETNLDYFGARYYAFSFGRFITSDPILITLELHNPQTWNKYSYVTNNPLLYTDPDGRWPTPFHEEVYRANFSDWGEAALAAINRGSAWVDSWDNQTSHLSFMHGMRDGDNPKQTAEDAARRAADYINAELEAAIRLQVEFILNGGTGYDATAMEHLGHALHTATDITSPQHAGYQPWYGQNNPGAALAHARAENAAVSSNKSSDVEARHQAHVAAAAMKYRFEQAVKKRTQPPQPKKKKKTPKTNNNNAPVLEK